MKRLSGVLKLFRNKYVTSIIVFIVWISFFDRNDLFTQWDRRQELKKLEAGKTFYEKEITTTRKDLMDLNNDRSVLEKFAREKFYMKKPNEQIYVVDDRRDEKKER